MNYMTTQVEWKNTAEMSNVNASRSDCHAWGSSPNIEFFRTILGIDSDAPGFARVKIEPHLGSIQNLRGEMPHPNGKISVQYINSNGQTSGVINLPEKVTGRFVWKGKSYPLNPGKNEINLSKNILSLFQTHSMVLVHSS